MYKTILFLIAVLTLNACQTQNQNEPTSLTPKTDVEITTVKHGRVKDNLELFATTVYLKRNVISAPIPAFIKQVNVRLGDEVRRGDVLYVLESKERRALGNQLAKVDTSLSSFGLIKVTAESRGIVSTLNKQQTGEYVLEGTQLCTISESNDLAFQVNVPYEFIQYVYPGKVCEVELPDNTSHQVVISTPLKSMKLMAQTETVLAKSKNPVSLPENLIVKVLVDKGNDSTKQVLPKSCVQSDEMMKEYWVMKLINDSTAVRVPVVTGNKNQDEFEILSPQFSATDRIVLSGSYGLGDTALVKIENGDR